MPGAEDVARSVGELSKGRGQALDALSGAAAGAGNAAHGLAEFFCSTDNLLALVVCLLAVAGIYRLLRAENIIPAPSRGSGGSFFAAFLARRLALRLIGFALLAALALVLAMGRLPGLVAALRGLF
ncbi:hypothetical protein [Solidesulfovibrio sp.]|uniref:hypothetical protein n=1 Tax=Solidesulfovibrio sp. TaxID=2910990 RepID=UPI002B211106|nr:hypothetical protein [Solidesulfovibrio sp.]MEA5088811.1 hypothetical protein [Solidesulfovibrio sp.]